MSESRERERCVNCLRRRCVGNVIEGVVLYIIYYILHIICVYVRYVQAELHRDDSSRSILIGDSVAIH